MKRTKYNNVKVVVDGLKFDSKKESRRYFDLKNLERAGIISDLELQPVYEFVANGFKICKYKADFRYTENGNEVVEDVKSAATQKNAVYRLKKRMMRAFYGIEIKET